MSSRQSQELGCKMQMDQRNSGRKIPAEKKLEESRFEEASGVRTRQNHPQDGKAKATNRVGLISNENYTSQSWE